MDIIAVLISIFALFIAYDTRRKLSSFNFEKAKDLKNLTESKPKPVKVSNDNKVSIQKAQQTSKHINWESVFLKIGAGFIILALLWFAKYAFDKNWIGEYGRITLASLASIAIFVFSIFDSEKNLKRGLTLSAVGLSSFVTTMYVAFNNYNIINGFLFIATSLFAILATTALAYFRNSHYLAIFSFAVGYAIPLLGGEGSSNTIFNYLMMLAVPGLALAYFARWTSVSYFVSFVSFIYITVMALFDEIDFEPYLIIFSALFVSYSYLHFISRDVNKKEFINNVFLLVLSAINIFYFAGLVFADYQDMIAFIAIVSSFVYAILGAFVYMSSRLLKGFAAFLSIAIFLFATGIVILLGKESLPAVLSILAFVISNVIFYAFKNAESAPDNSFKALYALAIVSTIPYLVDKYLRFSIKGVDFIFSASVLSAFLLLILSSMQIQLNKILLTSKQSTELNKINIAIIAILSILLVWMIPHKLFSYGLASFISLIIYAIIGVALFIQDKSKKLGLILLLAIIARVIIVEIWTLDVLYRILVFAALGALLIATTYNYKIRNKNLKVKEEDAYEQKNNN